MIISHPSLHYALPISSPSRQTDRAILCCRCTTKTNATDGGSSGLLYRRVARYLSPRDEPTIQKAGATSVGRVRLRSEEHTSELQSLRHLVCRLLLEKK